MANNFRYGGHRGKLNRLNSYFNGAVFKKYTFALILVFFVTACDAKEEPLEVPRTEMSKKAAQLDEYFTALRDLKEFNGSLLVTQEGQILLNKAYNINSDTNSSSFVTTDSQFEISSVTKLMAKAFILKLENKGLLQRTDTLDKYFPGFPNGEKITLQMLLSHKSGLPRDYSHLTENKINVTAQKAIDYAKKETLEFEPGTDQLYSNIGFQLIFSLIGHVTGKPFMQAMKDEIFDPLQMDSSGGHFGVNIENSTQVVKSHQRIKDVMIPITSQTMNEYRQGRVYSTTHDLMVFLNFLKQEPYKSYVMRKNGTIRKNGSSDGSYAYIHADTILNYDFVMLANYDATDFSQIIRDIKNILGGKAYQVPKEVNRLSVSLSIDTLQKYVGKYDFEAINHTILEFRIEDQGLVLYQDGEKQSDLFAESKSVFFDSPKSRDSFIFNEENPEELTYLFKGLSLKAVKVAD